MYLVYSVNVFYVLFLISDGMLMVVSNVLVDSYLLVSMGCGEFLFFWVRKLCL